MDEGTPYLSAINGSEWPVSCPSAFERLKAEPDLAQIIAIARALAIMLFMFIAAILLLATSTAQAGNGISPRCHRYDGRVFSGRIEKLRLRRSTKNAWSAEDANCDRFFFPAKLGSSVSVGMGRRITHDMNSHVAPSDDYVQLDAIVRIIIDGDRAGGALTVITVRSRAK